MRRPRRAWSCNFIWEAYENYWWRGSFKANQEELDRLAADVRCAVDGNDQDGFVEAAYAILQWGGVTASNGETLSDLGETALSTFHEASRLLDPPHSDTSRLDGVRYMNAGWTKVYALMLDDFPIYDGRVGAAMGYLVQQYCIRAGLRQVPTLLCFRWWVGGKGRAEPQSVDGRVAVPGADRCEPPDVGGVQHQGGVDPGRSVPRRQIRRPSPGSSIAGSRSGPVHDWLRTPHVCLT